MNIKVRLISNVFCVLYVFRYGFGVGEELELIRIFFFLVKDYEIGSVCIEGCDYDNFLWNVGWKKRE